MNTAKYDADTRKHLKRFQRSPAYQVMKKEHLAAREQLEATIRKRNEAIERLKKKLLAAGFATDEVEKLAA